MQLQITPRPTKKSLAYKSGRQNGMRIQLLINKSNWTLRRISDCVSITNENDIINPSGIVNDVNNENDIINQSGIVNDVKLDFRNLINTLKGKRNTPHYILALEKCWLLPIEKIRELYQLDLIGEPSLKEQSELTDYYNKILSEARKDGSYLNPLSQSSNTRNGDSHGTWRTCKWKL